MIRVHIVADKILNLLERVKHSLSIQDICYHLGEPVALIHLGISHLTREGLVEVESKQYNNYVSLSKKNELCLQN